MSLCLLRGESRTPSTETQLKIGWEERERGYHSVTTQDINIGELGRKGYIRTLKPLSEYRPREDNRNEMSESKGCVGSLVRLYLG